MKRTSRSLQVPSGEIGRRADALRDVASAVQELALARDEMAAIDVALPRADRDRLLIEPLSRVSLVERFCREVLTRYRWEPAK